MIVPDVERQDISSIGAIDDDSRLLAEALAGNAAAFALLVGRHERGLYIFCTKLIGDTEQARDVMQDLWIRVAGLPDAASVENPHAFFYRIARNLCLDHLRRARRHAGRILSFMQMWRSEGGEEESTDAIVQHALRSLPLKFREVLILKYYAGYKYDEIAAMMDLSVGAVTMRHKRGLEKMRKMMADYR